MKSVKKIVLFFTIISSVFNCGISAKEILAQKNKETLDFDVVQLIDKAKEVRENAYCPYSKFKVGAAVLTDKGNIYTGCNVENASYGLTVCAERIAIFKMVAAGERKIKAIAVVLDGDVASPCGACRQVIYEFGQDALVVMSPINGEREIVKITDLLPYAFNLDENKD